MTDLIDEPGVFEAWLESGTIRREQVTIYNDPALEAEFDALEAKRAELAALPQERSLTDKRAAAELDKVEADLMARLAASKSVWTVRALDDDEWDALIAPFPDPPAPERPVFEDDAAKAEWWNGTVLPWQDVCAAQNQKRQLALIARAVESVETHQGTASGVSVKALETMRAKTYGTYRIKQLWDAVNKAKSGEVNVPAPKSLNTSGDTPA